MSSWVTLFPWGTMAFPAPLQLEDWPQHGDDQVREEARGLSRLQFTPVLGWVGFICRKGPLSSPTCIDSRSPKEETRAHRMFSWGREPTFHEASCLLSFILIHSPTHFHTWVNSCPVGCFLSLLFPWFHLASKESLNSVGNHT